MGTVTPIKQKLYNFGDSLQNFVTKLWTGKDPASHTHFALHLLDRETLNKAYRGDWIAKKVVKAPAEDATREWRMWQASKEQISAIEDTEKRIGLQVKLKAAIIKARLFGGAGIIIGVRDGKNPDEELNLEGVQQDGLAFIRVLSKHDLMTSQIETDLTSPYFARPQMYQLSSTFLRAQQGQADPSVKLGDFIHPSRIIPLYGEPLADETLLADGWNADSSLQSVADVIKQVGTSTGAVASMLHDAKLDIINVPGLAEIMADDKASAKLIDRFTLANQSKSITNALLLGEDEKWQRISTQFAGLPDIIRVYLLLAAGASDIPVSRLLGQMSRNLGATSGGETDTRNYYDRISSEQNTILAPALMPLDEVILRSALGSKDPKIHYIWPPLWQLDETEKATVALNKANATKIYIDTGLFNEDALRKGIKNQLIEDSIYPGIEDAFDEFGDAPPEPTPEEKAAAAALAANALKPPAQVGAPPAQKQLPPPKPAPAKVGDSAIRSLYVCRMVLNAEEILAWAKSQGIPNLMPADQLHVTLIYSTAALDWMKISAPWCMNSSGDGSMTVPPGGARLIDKMGNALALLFNSTELQWRNADIRQAGASSTYPDYQPHISLAYDLPNGFDFSEIEPYRGKIELGPEIFEEIKGDDWHPDYQQDAANEPPYRTRDDDPIPASVDPDEEQNDPPPSKIAGTGKLKNYTKKRKRKPSNK